MAIDFPQRAPTLVGSSVVLRQLDELVLDVYEELVGDPDVAMWTSSTATYTREQLLDWLTTRAGSPNRLDWAIFQSQVFVGEIVLNEFDAKSQTMNLRIALLPSQSSKGFGSQAVKLVSDFAFEVLGLERLTLDVLPHNQRAIRSYLKSGFEKYDELIESGVVFDLMELRAAKHKRITLP